MLVGVALVRSHPAHGRHARRRALPGPTTRCPRWPAPRPSAPHAAAAFRGELASTPPARVRISIAAWWSSTSASTAGAAPGEPREAPEHAARSGASRVRGGSCALSGPAVLTDLRQGSGVPPRTGRDSARAPCPRRYSPRRALTATRTNAATPPTAQPTTAQIGPLATNATMTPARVRANQTPMAAGSSSTRRTRASSRSEPRRLVTLPRRRPASRSPQGRPDR